MHTIEDTYEINAPIDRVWWALTTAEGGEAWGAGPAKFNATEGGEFSYWDDDIHGTNTKLAAPTLLEQDWYGHDNPSWKYVAKFVLEAKSDTSTTVHLYFSGDIQDEKKDLSDWREYYFEPIQKLLES